MNKNQAGHRQERSRCLKDGQAAKAEAREKTWHHLNGPDLRGPQAAVDHLHGRTLALLNSLPISLDMLQLYIFTWTSP